MFSAQFHQRFKGNRKVFFFCCLILACFFSANSFAYADWFVKPSTEIPLRRGQGTDYKITAILSDGIKVTILDEAAPWVKIETEEGKSGWILKRYLSQDIPVGKVIESLETDNETLKDELFTISQENIELSNSNKLLSEKLSVAVASLESLKVEHEQLVKDTSDVIAIKNDLTTSKETMRKLQQDLGVISAENKRIKASQNIKWFLAGGGTLIFGCIVGMVSAKSKKKRSSLY